MNGVRKDIANSLEIQKTFTTDFQHLDVITIREEDAVIVINSIDIHCWGCCETVDYPNVIATKCDIGVTPTLCRNLSYFQMNETEVEKRMFKVIDTSAEALLEGVR